jgi:hypothetical protein
MTHRHNAQRTLSTAIGVFDYLGGDMGVELHITRSESWSDSDDAPITAEEWLAYVKADPELRPMPDKGPYYVLWLGVSAHEEPWLDWRRGNIYTKWPDTGLYLKMLDIAKQLDAGVHDDEDTVYKLPNDWQYDPSVKFVLPAKKKPWWKFW